MASFFTLILFSFFYVLYKKVSFSIIFKYLSITSFFILAIWLYTSNITGGMLNNRYTGKNAIGVQKDITTGRIDIFEIQFDNFLNNPLGIGVGNGKYERLKRSDSQVAGTGLGLAISKAVMLAQNGDIRVSNHPEGGAEFVVIFPKYKAADSGRSEFS